MEIAYPPVFAGAVQETVIWDTPAVLDVIDGAPGTSYGVTLALAELAAPQPALLEARTVHVCATPHALGVTTRLVVAPLPVVDTTAEPVVGVQVTS